LIQILNTPVIINNRRGYFFDFLYIDEASKLIYFTVAGV